LGGATLGDELIINNTHNNMPHEKGREQQSQGVGCSDSAMYHQINVSIFTGDLKSIGL